MAHDVPCRGAWAARVEELCPRTASQVIRKAAGYTSRREGRGVMSEQVSDRGRRGMYTRAFTRAEAEAQQPATIPPRARNFWTR